VVAITCIVSLCVLLVAALRRPRFASLPGRVTIAMFSGLFLPTIVLVAFLPRPTTTVHLVAYAGWSGALLSLLLALSAAARPNATIARLLVAAPSVAAVSSFVALAAERWPILAHARFAEPVAGGAMLVAELAWVAIPVVAALSLRVKWSDPRARTGIVLGGMAFFLVEALFAWAASLLRQNYGDVLYYAIRAHIFVDTWPSLYGHVAGLYAMVATVALASSDAARRQIGVGLLLFFGAGITPRMPVTIALAVLGVALLSRVVVALSPLPVDAPEHAVADERAI
jgi:hypothetical protein